MKAKVDYEVVACVKYIEEHAMEIAKEVNKSFEDSKEEIKSKIIQEIKNYIESIPVHYEWKDDGCPYDHSGILVKDGVVDMEQTVSNFLESEYSGQTEATYMSGCGFHYRSYGDELSYETLDIAEEIMIRIIRKYIISFNTDLLENQIEYIISDCHDYVYDNCLAFDFFNYEPAIKFVDIGELTLNQIKEM